jgi:hypothetical protein
MSSPIGKKFSINIPGFGAVSLGDKMDSLARGKQLEKTEYRETYDLNGDGKADVVRHKMIFNQGDAFTVKVGNDEYSLHGNMNGPLFNIEHRTPEQIEQWSTGSQYGVYEVNEHIIMDSKGKPKFAENDGTRADFTGIAVIVKPGGAE